MELSTSKLTTNSKAKPDGAITDNPVHAHEAFWLTLILEVKRYLFSNPSGVDAQHQAALYWALFWATRLDTPFSKSVRPALQLECLGPHLRLSAMYVSGSKLSLVSGTFGRVVEGLLAEPCCTSLVRWPKPLWWSVLLVKAVLHVGLRRSPSLRCSTHCPCSMRHSSWWSLHACFRPC